MKKWWNSITISQKLWIIFSTIAVLVCGIISGDTPINILIGTVGMFYVAVYSTGVRGAFLLGVVYVSLYTIICLENRIMLDALQNIVLIPIYIYSFIYWGKNRIKPHNLSKKKSVFVLLSAAVIFVILWGVSKFLHGNYSELDALNTTCTLYAMILGLYGISLNWALWTINNVVSALTFGLALSTPTGSITVFIMKIIFMVNGLIGWYNFVKIGKCTLYGKTVKIKKSKIRFEDAYFDSEFESTVLYFNVPKRWLPIKYDDAKFATVCIELYEETAPYNCHVMISPTRYCEPNWIKRLTYDYGFEDYDWTDWDITDDEIKIFLSKAGY